MPEAANLTRHQMDIFHPDSNTKIWFGWKDCFKIPDSADFDQKPVDFVNNLVYYNIKLMSKCFNSVAFIVQHIDEN